MRDWKEANSVFTTIAGSQRTQPDGGGRQRRAGTLSRRRRVVGSVSDARHASDSRSRLHARGRSRRRRRRRAARLRRLDASLRRAARTSSAEPILVNSKPHVVVGVMPQGFAFPNNQKLWVPLVPLVAKDLRNVPRSLRIWPTETWRHDGAGASGARRHCGAPRVAVSRHERGLGVAAANAAGGVSSARKCRWYSC